MKTKLNVFLTLFMVLLAQITFAQERVVNGVVKDASGLPLPGANVIVKGTNKGTQTDFDGKYSIKASSGDVLVFSFVGMKTQEASASSTTVNIQLKDNSVELEGVVVTALNIKKEQKAITYAAQELKGKSITEAREQNLVNALSGRISGVQVTNSSGAVGASSRITLRGVGSLTGSNEPLFIVDGIIYDNRTFGNAGSSGGRDLPNGISNINPDDVESINVLKGPAASALYGMRGQFGVIMITTKSGKNKDKFEVTFNTNTTFSNPLILPNYQNSYGQGATSDYFEFVDGAGGGYNDGVDESWGPALDRGLEFVQWDSYKVGGQPTPWISHPNNVKDFYDTGINQSNSIIITKGSETSNMKLLVGNSDEKGTIPNTDFKKVNVSFNGNMDLGKNFKVGATANYVNSKSNNLPNVGYTSENVVQQFIWSARNVNFTDLKDWRNLPLAPVGTAAEGTPLNWNNVFQNNPYWVLATNRNTLDQDRITGNTYLNFKINNNFSVNGKVTLDHYSQRETIRKDIGTNEFQDGSYQEVNRRFSEINAEAILTYQGKINDSFSLTLNAGMNSMKNINTFQSGLLNALELPGLFTLGNVKAGSTPILSSSYSEYRINSIMGFGQLAYKNYAFLDFTARNDWSSVLPVDKNNFFYPSLTASFILSDIFGFNDKKINYVKLRGGWAQTGSSGVLQPYNINPIFNLTNNGFGTVSSVPNTIFNPKIKNERVTGIEFGLDINGFDNRLRFSGTYYNQKNKDLIVNSQVSTGTLYNFAWQNAALMVNKGVELQLGATLVKNDNFSFDLDLNFAKNSNMVESLGKGLDALVLGGQWDMELQARPGEQYGVIVGYPYARNENGQIIYEDGLPKVNNSEKVALGNITPDWTGGANFTFKYKNFDLSTLLDAKIGGDLFSMTYMWGRYAGTLEETLIGRETGVVGKGVVSDGNGGWTPNNVVVDAKTFNQFAYDYSNFTESGVFDASYVKLRQIVLGYSLPKKWLNGTFIQDFRVSLVGRNLAILYKKVPHIDPETGFSSANGEQGQEFGQLPSARTYGFNINIKF